MKTLIIQIIHLMEVYNGGRQHCCKVNQHNNSYSNYSKTCQPCWWPRTPRNQILLGSTWEYCCHIKNKVSIDYFNELIVKLDGPTCEPQGEMHNFII